MFSRKLEALIQQRFNDHKVVVLIGPRQVGKTTLIKEFLLKGKSYLFINGDDPQVVEQFKGAGLQRIKQILENHKLLFVDEAQRITEIGLIAKIIHDQLPDVKVILSGSSALELTQTINESMTGRKWEYYLYPISWQEYQEKVGYLVAKTSLERRLIYGFYPEVLNNEGSEKEILTQLAGSYLYKDILEFGGLRRSELLVRILKALAFQVGNEVSYSELAQTVEADKQTVLSYINLLEKVYVIFRLDPLSRNSRNEISSSRKIYFYDNGIRNAIIGAFQPLNLRNDVGALWENFLISERIKRNHYTERHVLTYFWRTYQQQEIDYIEEIDGQISAWEFKWNPKAKVRFSSTFVEKYQPILTEGINQQNFTEFLSHS